MIRISKMLFTSLLCVCLTVICSINTFALATDNLSEGTYSVNSSLSCYVNAMGGVEFGTPLLLSSQVNIDSQQNKTITLNFTKSSVTIYNITCDTFIDIEPSSDESSGNVKNGTLGVYDSNGALQTSSVEYTLSDDTALNSKNEAVHYVSSMTFPIDSVKDTYELTLYINSNVMGVQFGADGSSNSATLTVDWNSLKSKNANQEEQYETLPDTTDAVQASTEVIIQDEADDNVVEKDGLNIHYANGEEEQVETSKYTAHLNMTMIWILVGTSAVVIFVGVAFIISSKIKGKQGE